MTVGELVEILQAQDQDLPVHATVIPEEYSTGLVTSVEVFADQVDLWVR